VVEQLDQLQLDRLGTALAGRYQLVRRVGEGGMAAVYLARDLRHHRNVALKVLRAELIASLGPDRFLREIRVVANLQHPHILPLFDSGEANGLLYYVMPLVEQESLRQRLARKPRLPMHQMLQIAREAAQALAYAHEQGVIHCDVKPENILLQNGHVLMADFGIARAVGAPAAEASPGSTDVVGTPHYMSPEQALGEAELDGRSDVYSLGCVLYEMLAGAPPFTGPTTTTVLAQHSLQPVPSVRDLRPTTPQGVEAAVGRALAKTPAQRPAMSELAEVLSELEAEATARRRTRSGSWAGWGRRRVQLWSVGLAVLAALAVGWAVWRTHRLDDVPARAPAGLDPRHIAVLYFEQRSVQDSLAYLADGVSEELIHQLSGVPALQVISQNGVRPYRGTNVAPDSIARALKVGTLVQGTVAQSGNLLRLTVSLIDGSTGAEISSTTIERPHQEIFALQEDLAKEVSVFLRRRLGEEVQRRLGESRAGMHQPRAWHLFQHAEELTRDVDTLLAAGDTAGAGDRLRRADSLLVLAQRVEPKWVRPTVSRGRLAFRRLDLIGTFDKRYYGTWTEKGLGHAQRALALDADNPEALELRGVLRYYRWILNLSPNPEESARLLTGAQADLEAAVALDPNAAFAWTVLSHLRMSQNDMAQAKLAAGRAYAADPYLSSAKQTIWRLFQSSLELEDAREAKRWCREGQQRFPAYYRFTECELWLYALKSETPNIARVEQIYPRYLELTPPNARAYHEHYGQMLVAIALARADLRDSANAMAIRARADTSLDASRELALLEAIVRTILGERDEALRQLGIYLEANPQLRAGMARDQTWWFRDLRQDPRYREITATSGR
jgi:TolB-like protein